MIKDILQVIGAVLFVFGLLGLWVIVLIYAHKWLDNLRDWIYDYLNH